MQESATGAGRVREDSNLVFKPEPNKATATSSAAFARKHKTSPNAKMTATWKVVGKGGPAQTSQIHSRNRIQGADNVQLGPLSPSASPTTSLDLSSNTPSNDFNPVSAARPKSALQFFTSEDNAKALVLKEAEAKADQAAQDERWRKLFKTLGYSDELLDRAAGIDPSAPRCDVCNRADIPGPLGEAHNVTYEHMQAISAAQQKDNGPGRAQTLPPTIDRTRFGLKILAKHGYDPVNNPGLGVRGQGITAPIELEQNKDKAGIGTRPRPDYNRTTVNKPVKKTMNVKECRRQHERDKKRNAQLEKLFYSNNHDEFFELLERK